MAKESVQAVRQAELNAAQTERYALQRKEEILSEAGQKAKVLITSMTKQALDKAEYNLSAANQKGFEMMENAKIKAEGEALVMKEMVRSKEKAAINLVLACVIHDN